MYTVRPAPPDSVKEKLKHYPELTQTLLYARGITTKQDAEVFLEPQYESHVHDPFLMYGMDKAVWRILRAIKKKEHIVVYSDYDCDGIPGGVIIHDFFKKIGYENFSNYIPHRHEEGYGLNLSAIEKAHDTGATLLITVDCGITDVVPVNRANKLGIDVIITDHHLENGKPPKAYVILNPNQKKDTTYPFKGLCGAGVAFKLVQGLIRRGGFDIINGWEKWLLDMAGLSTMTDMVPLRGENRAISYYGLQVLRKSRRVGIQELCRKIRINQRTLSEDDIGFMIGPRINAASRMDRPEDAFQLLSTTDVVSAGTLSGHLDKLNNERKGVVASIVRDIKKRIQRLSSVPEVIVMGNPKWKPALLGLVANTVSEEYERPVFLWGRDENGIIKGSVRRGLDMINVVEFLGSIKDLFIDAGGHAFSGGFSVVPEKIHTFEQVITDAYKHFPKKAGTDTRFVDKKMTIADVTWDTYREIEKFAPFGVGNEKPLFLFEGSTVSAVEHFGKDKNHLRVRFTNGNGGHVSAIGFFTTVDDHDVELTEGAKVDLVASFEKSMFLNKPELRLRIIDIY